MQKNQITIKKFIDKSIGEWKSLRSTHTIAFQEFENTTSNIDISYQNLDSNETKNILKKIEVIDINGKIEEIDVENLNLQYRSSNLKKSDVVTKATFKLSYGSIEEITKKIDKIRVQREKNQPLKEKTSGSTFKNPPNNFAASLIEKSGCKGLEIGDAKVSLKHANFLINKGKASSTDIEELGKVIREKVFKKFDILLDWEIKIIGD